MVYIYLTIIMVVVLATAFYVRTIKTKMDTKVDAMFQLVQSMARELNSLKSSHSSRPNEVIELDIGSNDNRVVVSEQGSSEDESSSDGSYEDTASETSNDEKLNTIPIDIEVTKLDVTQILDNEEDIFQVGEETKETEIKDIEIKDIEIKDIEIKEVTLEPLEDQNYEALTVKELKELVSVKGGKVAGKKKADLIEYLSA